VPAQIRFIRNPRHAAIVAVVGVAVLAAVIAGVVAASSGPSVSNCAKALENAYHAEQNSGKRPTAADVEACRWPEPGEIRKAVGIAFSDLIHLGGS
jgi:hypothetical protein